MQTSNDRILTTHVGSLPRSDALLAMLNDMEQDKAVDRVRFREKAKNEIAEAVRQQRDCRLAHRLMNDVPGSTPA